RCHAARPRTRASDGDARAASHTRRALKGRSRQTHRSCRCPGGLSTSTSCLGTSSVLLSQGLIAPGGAFGVGSMPHAVLTLLQAPPCDKRVGWGQRGSVSAWRARRRRAEVGGDLTHPPRP